MLVPVYGVSVDKALALRGDAALRISFGQPHQHIHAHITPQTYDEIFNKLPDDPPHLPQHGIHAPEDTPRVIRRSEISKKERVVRSENN